MATLLFWSIIGLSSLFLILKSAENALGSIMRFANKAKIAYYFVGLLIIGIGTSLPEIFTSLVSSLEGSPLLPIGDAMGSTIIDLTLVMGLTLIIARKMILSEKEERIIPWKVLVVIALPLLLALDGKLDRFDGFLMVSGFVLYYLYNIVREVHLQDLAKYLSPGFVGKETFIFGASLGVLIFGVQLLVLSGTRIAYALNLSSYIFGVLFLALATASPELVINIKSALNRESIAIAFGDIFGSVVCNCTLVIGLAALIHPAEFAIKTFYTAGAFLLISAIYAIWCLRQRKLDWIMGTGMVSIYMIFILVQAFHF